MLTIKRSTDVTPEVNLQECTSHMHVPSVNKAAHWLWNPESREVQNRGISSPIKVHVSTKNLKNKKSVNGWILFYLSTVCDNFLELEPTRKKHKCNCLHFSNHQKWNEIGSQGTVMISLSFSFFSSLFLFVWNSREVYLAKQTDRKLRKYTPVFHYITTENFQFSQRLVSVPSS